MYTDKKQFVEDFLFNKEKHNCLAKERDGIALCGKYDVAAGVQIVLVSHQRDEENFMHLSFEDDRISPSMILLPEKNIAIEITGEVSGIFERGYLNWSQKRGEIEKYENGKIFCSYFEELIAAAKEWVQDEILQIAKENSTILNVEYARYDAFRAFMYRAGKETSISNEMKKHLFNDGYSIDAGFSSAFLVDFLLHNKEEEYRHHWAAQLLKNPSVRKQVEKFLDWSTSFAAAFDELQALPENGKAKQYRKLLFAISDSKSLNAEFVSDNAQLVQCKISASDLTRAIMQSEREDNPRIGWKENLYLNDLKRVTFRKKIIWERKPIG